MLEIPLKYLGEDVYYVELYYRFLSNPRKKLHTMFAIMPAKGKLDSERNQSLINYRVDDLESFVQKLVGRKVKVDPIHQVPDAEGIGKFTHLKDPEGNRIELWQPSTGI
ncbi:MAG: VOC family protein [archaeon]|nr:VOC family protein [archaeon]